MKTDITRNNKCCFLPYNLLPPLPFYKSLPRIFSLNYLQLINHTLNQSTIHHFMKHLLYITNTVQLKCCLSGVQFVHICDVTVTVSDTLSFLQMNFERSSAPFLISFHYIKFIFDLLLLRLDKCCIQIAHISRSNESRCFTTVYFPDGPDPTMANSTS